MVRTPFTWPYGGHRVCLSGSFNGWGERLPMDLMEGSITTFQKIIDLPSGYHQYKFFVDGAWQVDPHQACITDEYGTVNIILVSGDDEQIPQVFVAESSHSQPSTSHRIDAEEAMPFVLNEPMLGFLHGGDNDLLRRALSTHLLSHTAYEIIPVSGKVVALDVEIGVEHALHVMHDEGLNVVPLWDEQNRQIRRMLTASDFVMILLLLYRNPAILTNRQLETWTISAWKEWKLLHYREIIGTLVPHHIRPLISAAPDDSLGDVATMILRNNISSVPIINTVNGSSVLLHVTCLAGILKNICSYFRDNVGHIPLLQQPIGSLPVGTWTTVRPNSRQLLVLQPRDLLTRALSLFLEAEISSMPVVDESYNIMDIFSRSDITSLARNNIYARIQVDQITVSQALEIAGEGRRQSPRYHTCTSFDSLNRVMEILSEPNVRRVIVVGAASERRLEGIVTLSDVFRFFLQ